MMPDHRLDILDHLFFVAACPIPFGGPVEGIATQAPLGRLSTVGALMKSAPMSGNSGFQMECVYSGTNPRRADYLSGAELKMISSGSQN
jgi:hypothetical protein